MELLYSSFLAEGILDASLFTYINKLTGITSEYVIIITGTDMYFVNFNNELPGIKCSTIYRDDIYPGIYSYNYTLYSKDC